MSQSSALPETLEALSERPLRICYVADPRSIHTARWIRFFAGLGHTVGLISNHPPNHGLQVDGFWALASRSGMPATRIPLNVLQVRKAIRDFRPHVLHAHYINEAGWLAALSGFRPFVLTAWGSDIYLAPRKSRLARVLSPWAVRRADYITADSHDQIERLVEMGARPDRTEMVTWGVELDKFDGRGGAQWRAKRGIGPERILILSPREWLPNSNIDVLLRAFAVARHQRPHLLLALKTYKSTTPHEREKSVEADIRALGLADSILVLEEEPEDTLPGMYGAADITVSICSSDGTAVSVLEAMSSQSALVVSNLPSLAEWVVDGTSGFLVPPRSVEELAARIALLADNPELRRRLGQGARSALDPRGDRARNFGRVEAAYRRLALGHAAVHASSVARVSLNG